MSDRNLQDAFRQLEIAEKNITHAQRSYQNADDPNQQEWMQNTLDAVNKAKGIIEASLK